MRRASRAGLLFFAAALLGAVAANAAAETALPVNTSPPTLSGTPEQDQTLSATLGSWANSPTSYMIKWWDCTPNGSSCVQDQASGATYKLVASDVGYWVHVQVFACNAAGCGQATSTAAAVQPPSAGSGWDPSGQTMPVGDLAGWHQVFADNFAGDNVPLGAWSGCTQNGSVLTSHCVGLPPNVDQNWWAYPDGWAGTPTDGTYYPSRSLSIENGVMDMWIHSEVINGVDTHVIAAPVPKDPAATGSWGGQTYGKYIVRMRLDSTQGYHLSFLWWPDDNVWPQEGSIDWPEAEFNQADTDAFLQWRGNTVCQSGDCPQDYFHTSNIPMSSGWHTYELDWTASAIDYYMDGTLIGQSTDPSHIPDTALHWVLQTGRSSSEPVSDSDSSHVQVDWAVIYEPS